MVQDKLPPREGGLHLPHFLCGQTGRGSRQWEKKAVVEALLHGVKLVEIGRSESMGEVGEYCLWSIRNREVARVAQ
mgnify:CR=1 FL=1